LKTKREREISEYELEKRVNVSGEPETTTTRRRRRRATTVVVIVVVRVPSFW